MSAEKNKNPKYKTISSRVSEKGATGKAASTFSNEINKGRSSTPTFRHGVRLNSTSETVELGDFEETNRAEAAGPESGENGLEDGRESVSVLPYAEQLKQQKEQKRREKEERLLNRDKWRSNKGHTLTYAGIFLFTLVIYFRPYELVPALSGLNSIALVIALITLVIYVPTQLSDENNLTTLSTEIKCIMVLVACALATIPIAKDPALAWTKFSDNFSKVAIMFVIMVNTLRTRSRLKGLMWLSVGIGVFLSYQAIGYYRQGVFKTEDYRVSVDFGGMFGNPNDMAMHLAIFTPIALTLAFATKNKLAKIVYFVAVGMMVAGILVTQSRGGFLGLVGMAPVLALKIGRSQRLKVMLLSVVSGLFVMILAPGNYGLRLLSIFIPALDPSGSSDQRRELLIQSIIVTLRNPWGIGMGNFPLVAVQNRETHNAYTQVSAELGVIALVAYLILLISPWRKLRAIERRLYLERDHSWVYYMAIGVQASIVAYAISSFFGAVAYNWFIYYPIAYAVCLRRIYQNGDAENADRVAGFDYPGNGSKEQVLK